jgi:hypothetical protein
MITLNSLLTLINLTLTKLPARVARGSVVSGGWKVTGSISDEVIGVFNLPNPSSRTVALGSTQRLTEMSTRNLPGGKGRPACKTDNLTAFCEPII